MNGMTKQERWRANQRKKGRCIDCAQDTEPNRIRCATHLALATERATSSRRREKDA